MGFQKTLKWPLVLAILAFLHSLPYLFFPESPHLLLPLKSLLSLSVPLDSIIPLGRPFSPHSSLLNTHSPWLSGMWPAYHILNSHILASTCCVCGLWSKADFFPLALSIFLQISLLCHLLKQLSTIIVVNVPHFLFPLLHCQTFRYLKGCVHPAL